MSRPDGSALVGGGGRCPSHVMSHLFSFYPLPWDNCHDSSDLHLNCLKLVPTSKGPRSDLMKTAAAQSCIDDGQIRVVMMSILHSSAHGSVLFWSIAHATCRSAEAHPRLLLGGVRKCWPEGMHHPDCSRRLRRSMVARCPKLPMPRQDVPKLLHAVPAR